MTEKKQKEVSTEDIAKSLANMTKGMEDLSKAVQSINRRQTQTDGVLKQVLMPVGDENLEGEEDGTEPKYPYGIDVKGQAELELERRVFNPSDDELAMMTEIPQTMIWPLAVTRAVNTYINKCAFKPDDLTLLTDLFMKEFMIVMKSYKRQGIGEAMIFSKIQKEKRELEESEEGAF